MANEAFQRIFLEALDNALLSLGDSARQAIYYHLEVKFNIPRNQIPNRLVDFEDGLEGIFGAGTKFLEILIMKNLYENIKPKRKLVKWDEDKEFNFTDYVKAAQKTFSRGKRN